MSEDLTVTLISAIVVIVGQITSTWQSWIAAKASRETKAAISLMGQTLTGPLGQTKEDIEAFRAKVARFRNSIMEPPK